MKKHKRTLSLSEPKGKINKITKLAACYTLLGCVEHVNIYCSTCAERNYADMIRQKGRKKQTIDTKQNSSKMKAKRKSTNSKVPCVAKEQEPKSKGKTVRRSQVRVRSAKGVRKVNIFGNKQTRKFEKIKNERKVKSPKPQKVRSCHHSFTNLYYDF